MSAEKILYLGLKAPSPKVFHYPVIRTEFCGEIAPALALWPQFTHIIFTSQTTVHYWPGPWDKPAIAIGEATARCLREKGCKVVVAKTATQEGVLETVCAFRRGYFFIPHSKKARPFLTDALRAEGTAFYALDLYDTVYQKPEPVPDLSQFDEIVFTSPSTVEGFLRIYGAFPAGKKLTAIGPVTEKTIRNRILNFCQIAR